MFPRASLICFVISMFPFHGIQVGCPLIVPPHSLLPGFAEGLVFHVFSLFLFYFSFCIGAYKLLMVGSFIANIENSQEWLLFRCLVVVADFWFLSPLQDSLFNLLGIGKCCLFDQTPGSLIMVYRIVYVPEAFSVSV